MAILSSGFTPPVLITLAVLALFALVIICYLVSELIKCFKINKLNKSRIRDKRFAYGLLSLYFKDGVIKNPYLLRSDKDCRPDADLVVVCEGGIVIVSVDDRPGFFETPQKGIWTLRTAEDVKRIPNLFEKGMYYVNACANIARRNGISCPIYNLVLLSNDNADYDRTLGDSVLTSDTFVDAIKSVRKSKKISPDEETRIYELLKQNDMYCRKLFTELSYDEGFIDKKEPVFKTEYNSYDIELSEENSGDDNQ